MLVKSSVSRGRAANEQTHVCYMWVNRCGRLVTVLVTTLTSSVWLGHLASSVTRSSCDKFTLPCDEFSVWWSPCGEFIVPYDSLCDDFTVMSLLFGEKVNSSHVTSSPCDEFTVSLYSATLCTELHNWYCACQSLINGFPFLSILNLAIVCWQCSTEHYMYWMWSA